MEISLEKWLVMALLTVVSIFLGLIPFFLMRYTKATIRTDAPVYNVVLTILSCFGGGVLFSTAALHVLPEVREQIENVPVIWETFDEHFPVAELFMLCGFALIYLVEEVAHFIMSDGHHGHHHHTSTVARHNSIAHAIPTPTTRPSTAMSMNTDDRSLKVPHQDMEKFQGEFSPRDEDEECPDDRTNLTSSLRAIMALIALSFHAIMEGVAIGIQNSSDLWFMFGAVASHKFVISFCMGMEMITSRAGWRTYVGSIAFFAIVSPIGIIIGSAISSSTSSTDSLGVVVVEGLVCGTLLYVVFFEILNRERERKSYTMPTSRAIGFIQFISLALGLFTMGSLITLTQHEHGHSENVNGTDPHEGHDHARFSS